MFGSNGKAVRSHSSRIQKRASTTDAILTASKPHNGKTPDICIGKSHFEIGKSRFEIGKSR
jgi:hypothetical protein